MSELNTVSRRGFLKGLGLLSIGFSLAGVGLPVARGQGLPGSLGRYPRIDSWLRIHANGQVQVLTGKLELGQGIRIAIAQVAGEELGIDPADIEVKLAETDVTPNEGYTAGSRSIEHSAVAVRHAAASAVAILRRRAAEELGTAPEALSVAEGAFHASNGRSVGFAALLEGERIEAEADPSVSLTPTAQRKWVGRSVPRQDIEGMVRGAETYVQDLRFDGMLHARVVRPPSYGGRLERCDAEAVRAEVDGVVEIVIRGSFVAVVTEKEYQAEQAQRRLKENCQWKVPSLPNGATDLPRYLKSNVTRSEQVVGQRLTFDAGSHRASYFRPYVMHGSIGPSCAVAAYDQQTMRVWTHSQGVYPLRESLAPLLGLERGRIKVIGVPGSGCYGHNGADDVAADAALIAQALPGRHVRLQWSREDEHAWEPNGSAMAMELEASLGASGRIEKWSYELWSDTHSVRPGGDAANLLPAQYLENPYDPPTEGFFGGSYRNAEPEYRIQRLSIRAHKARGPLRVSALRSLGAYANVFAIECFMDELAEIAGQDPVRFRLAHLSDQRARDVLERVAEMAREADAGAGEARGLGFAYSRYKNAAAYCAVAAEVAMGEDGKPSARRLWAAIDAGETINPDGLINQTEGGLIQSTSWTMREETAFDSDGVKSRDWSTYPIFKYADAPEVAVAVLDRPEQPPLGAGEAAQGPAAAAIANALYTASGRRIRSLPLLKAFETESSGG